MNKKLIFVIFVSSLSLVNTASVLAENSQYFSGEVSEADLLQAFGGGTMGASTKTESHGIEEGGTRAIVFGAAAPVTPAPSAPVPATVPESTSFPEVQAIAEPVAAASEPVVTESVCDSSRSVAVNIHFDYDSATIGQGQERQLGTLANVFLNPAYKECQIVVEGHTDASGAASYNEKLSEERARSIKSALVNNGVSSGRLVVVGYGSAVPYNAADPYDPVNRRVEFRLR